MEKKMETTIMGLYWGYITIITSNRTTRLAQRSIGPKESRHPNGTL